MRADGATERAAIVDDQRSPVHSDRATGCIGAADAQRSGIDDGRAVIGGAAGKGQRAASLLGQPAVGGIQAGIVNQGLRNRDVQAVAVNDRPARPHVCHGQAVDQIRIVGCSFERAAVEVQY